MNKVTRMKVFWALLYLPLFIILNSLFITPVSAHILQTDGSIGAVLHIDPDDDPIANQQAGFFFEFKDKQNKFTPEKCDCTFSIEEGGKQIYSQPLFQNNNSPSLTNASVFYTFQKRDVYEVKVTGKPYSSGDFQPFDLVYDIRVSRENNQPSSSSSSSSNLKYPILFVTAAIIVGAIVGVSLKRSKV